MNLSPRATELVALYEQEYNCKASELIFQVAKHLDKVGDMLRERGRKEAQKGGEPYPAEVFPVMAAKAFSLDQNTDQETIQMFADLWRSDYMDGYNAMKEVRIA